MRHSPHKYWQTAPNSYDEAMNGVGTRSMSTAVLLRWGIRWCQRCAYLVTLLYALQARGLRRGIAALCLGGGEAVALAVELTT